MVLAGEAFSTFSFFSFFLNHMEHIPVKISYAGEGRQTLSWSLLLLELKRCPPHCHQVLTRSASLKYCKLLLLLCEAPGD